MNVNKLSLVVIIGLLLTSCAHTRLDSWSNNEYTVCGNRWADQDDYKEKAQKSCSGSLTLIGGGSKVVGTQYVETLSGISGRNISQNCLTFRCN